MPPIRHQHETEIPEGHVLEPQPFHLIEKFQPKPGTNDNKGSDEDPDADPVYVLPDKGSDEDPFSETYSVADPVCVPETSTSHYSDSDEPGVYDEAGYPENHCFENNKNNKDKHYPMHPQNKRPTIL